MQTKRVGKNQQIITLGAANSPPTRHVAINGEITVLTELNAKDSGITASFAPAFDVAPVDKDEPMAQASASSSSLPTALQEKCDQSLKAVQHQSDQKCSKLMADTEKRLKELQEQVKADLKKFTDGEVQQRKQDIENLDKKLGTQLTQVQQEVKAASAVYYDSCSGNGRGQRQGASAVWIYCCCAGVAGIKHGEVPASLTCRNSSPLSARTSSIRSQA